MRHQPSPSEGDITWSTPGNQIAQLFPSELWLDILNKAFLPKLPLGELLALRTVSKIWKKSISLLSELDTQGFPHVSRLASIFMLKSLSIDQNTIFPDFKLFTALHTLTLADPTNPEGRYSSDMSEFSPLTNLTKLTLTSKCISSLGTLTSLQYLSLKKPFVMQQSEVLKRNHLTKVVSDSKLFFKEGQGIYKSLKDDCYYTGAFQEGMFHGMGRRLTPSNGHVHEGEWREDEPYRRGKTSFPNGDWYEGPIKYGKSHGQGTYYHVLGGYTIVGDYFLGKLRSRVVLHYDGGQDRYEGEFDETEGRHGTGTMYFANGDVYVGEFFENGRTGQATMTYANGDKYVGQWNDAKRHGEGVLHRVHGTKQEGQWKDDVFVQ